MYEVSLKKLIKKISTSDTGLKVGVVNSISPMTIRLENDEKILLGLSSLYIPLHLKEHIIRVTIPTLNLNEKEMQVHAGLKEGERVYLLSFAEGKKYIVLGRI